MVAGGPGTLRGAALGPSAIPAIVEELRATPASWVAVAQAIFGVQRFDAVYLLHAIPAAVLEAWLREMEGSQPPPAGGAEPRIPQRAKEIVRQVLGAFGSEDTRTLWLAALAVLLDSPADLAAGTVVWRARVALGRLAETPGGRRDPEAAGGNRWMEPDAPPVVARVEKGPSRTASEFPQPDAENGLPIRTRQEPGPTGAEHQRRFPVQPAAHASHPSPRAPAESSSPAPWRSSGVPTNAAGLFFLLNALRRLGMAEALSSGLARADPDFLARLLRRLAAHAGIAGDDPIVLWVDSAAGGPPDPAARPCPASWWPSNLRASRDTAPIESLVRVWSLAVRRWCWRQGRIAVRDIVMRPGVFSVNRTDLDVSLPLDEADVRIRRIGLDLDPGWLPWFGRVVRFHYLSRGELYG